MFYHFFGFIGAAILITSTFAQPLSRGYGERFDTCVGKDTIRLWIQSRYDSNLTLDFLQKRNWIKLIPSECGTATPKLTYGGNGLPLPADAKYTGNTRFLVNHGKGAVSPLWGDDWEKDLRSLVENLH